MSSRSAPARQLGLLDGVCIVAGIIVGAGLYETAPAIAGAVSSDVALFAIWGLGALLSLAGALCYAELATAYPREGGDYVYFNRAFGRWAGFLFAWGQLVIIRPGLIASMAFVFARYTSRLFALNSAEMWISTGAVIALTAINMVGVRQGKWTQNVLTAVKVLGLLAVALAGLFAGTGGGSAAPVGATEQAVASSSSGDLGLALIFVLFALGGWNEIAFVAAEVERPERNIVRAITLGLLVVAAIYMLVNAAFLRVLGRAGMAASKAIASDTIERVFSPEAAGVVVALIAISALGALNGLVFTGARIGWALGADYPGFRLLGRWDPKRGTPARALAIQAGLAILVIALAGTFGDSVLYATPVAWTFFMASAIALVVLRLRDAARPRPFRVPGYPVTPAVFALVCLGIASNSVSYAIHEDKIGPLVAVGALLAGVPAYLASRAR